MCKCLAVVGQGESSTHEEEVWGAYCEMWTMQGPVGHTEGFVCSFCSLKKANETYILSRTQNSERSFLATVKKWLEVEKRRGYRLFL